MTTSRRNLISLLTVLALALVGVIGIGMWPRLNKQKILLAEAKSESQQLPSVRVARAQAAVGSADIELPADLQAMIESPIYARVEGYISKRHVDIGWKVKKGQVLAELETPELDQQIKQARAAVSQSEAAVKYAEAKLVESKASLRLAEITTERWKKLAQEGVSSRQEADEKQAAFEVRKAETDAVVASLSAAREAKLALLANVSRLEEMTSFSKLPAPFDGIITYRHPDVGTLISAGTAKEVFRVADISTIRVFMNVPQAYVNSVRPGTPATLHVDDINQTFEVKIGGIANALDMTSRTMLAVIKLPNPGGMLMPGMFSRVQLKLPNAPSILTIPADTVVTRNEGTFVALVRPSDRRVEFRKIHITRDTGAKVEVSSGVRAGDMLITNPNDEIRENVLVNVQPEKATAKK